jgi:hypothetical protein
MPWQEVVCDMNDAVKHASSGNIYTHTHKHTHTHTPCRAHMYIYIYTYARIEGLRYFEVHIFQTLHMLIETISQTLYYNALLHSNLLTIWFCSLISVFHLNVISHAHWTSILWFISTLLRIRYCTVDVKKLRLPYRSHCFLGQSSTSLDARVV